MVSNEQQGGPASAWSPKESNKRSDMQSFDSVDKPDSDPVANHRPAEKHGMFLRNSTGSTGSAGSLRPRFSLPGSRNSLPAGVVKVRSTTPAIRSSAHAPGGLNGVKPTSGGNRSSLPAFLADEGAAKDSSRGRLSRVSFLSDGSDTPPVPSASRKSENAAFRQYKQAQENALRAIEGLSPNINDEDRAAAMARTFTQFQMNSNASREDKLLKLRWRVSKLISSQTFDGVVGIVILMNSVLIGFELSTSLNNGDTTVYTTCEHVFLMLYIAELGLRFFVSGWRCLQNSWVLFDFILVVLGVGSAWILKPLVGDGTDQVDTGPITVLRLMRLLRLARAVRLVVQFKTLWMLVRGLLSSTGTIIWTFLLITLILYIFACLGVEVITKNVQRDPASPEYSSEFEHLVDKYFASLPITMLTLVQFVTLDSIGEIYAPMVRHDPALVVYFMIFILVVAIALMNLVTGVIVESAILQANADREVQKAYEQKRREEIVPQFFQVLEDLDTDDSGKISLEELLNAEDDVLQELTRIMKVEDVMELFHMLDVDDLGEVDIPHFCEEMLHMAATDLQTTSLTCIMKQVRMNRLSLSKTEQRLERLEGSVESIARHLERALPLGNLPDPVRESHEFQLNHHFSMAEDQQEDRDSDEESCDVDARSEPSPPSSPCPPPAIGGLAQPRVSALNAGGTRQSAFAGGGTRQSALGGLGRVSNVGLAVPDAGPRRTRRPSHTVLPELTEEEQTALNSITPTAPSNVPSIRHSLMPGGAGSRQSLMQAGGSGPRVSFCPPAQTSGRMSLAIPQ